MALVQVRLVAFACLAMALAAAHPGQRNLETLKKFFKGVEFLKGKTVDKLLMDKVVAQLGNMFTSKLDCKSTTESPIGFELRGVSFAECCDEFAQMNLGMINLDWSTEFAVLEGTGGQNLLVWQPNLFELPSGARLSQDVAYRFEFDEDGKISKWAMELDTTALIADVTEKNIATVLRLYDSAKLLLKGNTLSPELVAKVVSKVASSYAPTYDCSLSPASSAGFDLKGVPLQVCAAKEVDFYGGAKQVDWVIDAIAAVPASGGTRILLWQRNAVEVAGLPLTMNIASKVDFNAAGLITGFAQELDTSAVLETQARAASLVSAVSLAAQLSSLALPGGFLLGCLVGTIPLAVLGACRHRLGSHEGYHRLAV